MVTDHLEAGLAPRAEALHVRFSWRRLFAVCRFGVVLVLLAVWFVAFRPVSLGGPAEYVMVAGTSMLPALKTDDVVVVRRHASYHVGDVVAYRIPKGNPAAGGRIIHRIVGGSAATGFTLRGDNRKTDDLWHPRQTDVIGAVSLRLPHAARLARLLRSPLVLASLAAGLVFALVVGSGGNDEKRRES